MRISDWSSDVCSSDLLYLGRGRRHGDVDQIALRQDIDRRQLSGSRAAVRRQQVDPDKRAGRGGAGQDIAADIRADKRSAQCGGRIAADAAQSAGQRSEEHTSELQSLMRISYAVFCLKTKKTTIYVKK